MNINCRKCGGKVFIDDVFSQKNHVELYCILCGNRWMVSKVRNAFGRWLTPNVRNMGLSTISTGTAYSTADFQ